jgi:two-component system, chemotaxis family, protein-glutamate methylesterase/glutaminase
MNTTTSEKVRVLIVDDSALMRKLLTSVLSADDGIEVVGAAPDPFAAREQIKALNPDVVTLDVEMPHMNGIDFLRKIMELRPTPVIMISTLTQAGAETTLEALEIGAVDFVAKPLDPGAVMQLGDELIPKIKAAALTRPRRRIAAPQQRPVRKALGASGGGSSDKLIAIGASTGGVEALKAVLMLFPEDTPPVVIAQHMPERFTAAFARRLDGECRMRVHEAAHDQPIERGHVYIAPGGHHLEVARRSSGLVCTLNDGPLVSGHRPSVDALFNSVARVVAPRAVGAILTGMGRDGANGLLAMRKAGCATLGQDEGTALVYGMPRVAFEIGAVQSQHGLFDISAAILDACAAKRSPALAGAGHS